MIEILFNDFKLKVIKEEVQQFDSKTVDIFFSGEFDDAYIYKMYLSHNDNLDLIVLTQNADGNYKTTLTETQLAFSGIYNIQILAIDKNDSDKKKHSNIVTFNCLESMSGDTHWVTIPTEFSQFETRLLRYISSVESKLIVHAEIDVNGHLIFTFADGNTADIGTVMIDVSSKQDKIDISLETSDKTIVGAINELQSAKGTYSKPGSGIPKSDLSSGIQSSLNKADTALQSHQDISGKADKTYVDTGLSNKVNKEQGKGLFSGSYNDLINKPDIPTKTSVLTNDSGFITNAVNNLINYYLKPETYNKTEINSLISQIQTSHFEIVAVLPTVGERNVIYLLPRQITETGNIYDEYIYISNAYEKIGSTDVDLTGYATETWVNTQIADFLTQMQIQGLINNALNDYYNKSEIDTALSLKENLSNKVTSVSSQSTDMQYPTAKCLYDIVGDIESLLSALR